MKFYATCAKTSENSTETPIIESTVKKFVSRDDCVGDLYICAKFDANLSTVGASAQMDEI